MDHDALHWRFGLAWVLFSFSQVDGGFSQHILGAPKFSAEKLSRASLSLDIQLLNLAETIHQRE